VAYLYNYAGMPWKTQERVSDIVHAFYDNTPAGLCGNDDCGQMSAWYIFSVLGFYPVNPASGVYVLGSPSLEKAGLHLQNGRSFTIRTVKTGPADIYIHHVELNGTPYPYSYITHRDIMNGGVLKVFMKATPNYHFGEAEAYRPKTLD
jgi:predicted alpha-1,2-mannosidase